MTGVPSAPNSTSFFIYLSILSRQVKLLEVMLNKIILQVSSPSESRPVQSSPSRPMMDVPVIVPRIEELSNFV